MTSLQFDNCPEYKRQVSVIRMKGSKPQQPSKGDMAVHAAREMRAYIVSVHFFACCRRGCLHHAHILQNSLEEEGTPFMYDLENLVLHSIVQVSQGSVQARIGLIPR